MTLALHGKSRQRQWLLVTIGILAVLGAVMAAITVRDELARAASVTPVQTGDGFENATCGELDDVYGNGQTWSQISTSTSPIEGQKYYAPGSSEYYVEITDVSAGNPMLMDWVSNFGIDAVMMKNANGANNLYIYDPPSESFGDTDLQSFLNPGSISHVIFCFDGYTLPAVEPTVGVEKTHTPDGPFFPGETFDWDITVTIEDGALTDDLIVSDEVDDRLVLDSIEATDAFTPCEIIDDNSVACTLPEGTEPGTYVLTLVINVPEDIEQCGVIDNTARIAGGDVEGEEDTSDDSVTVVCEQELDPSLEKSYSGSDDQSFSWTVQISNPSDTNVEVQLYDEGARLVVPSTYCVEGPFPDRWDCTIPPGDVAVYLYTPIGDHDECEPFDNTAILYVGEREVDRDTATAPPTGEDCNKVTYQVCKAIDDSDLESGTFVIEIDGVDVDFTVTAAGKAGIVCDDIQYVDIGTEVNISEVVPAGWENPIYLLNGSEAPAPDGVGITVGPETCDYQEEREVNALVAGAAPGVVDCQVIVLNRYVADSDVTVDKSHTPDEGPFNPGDTFTWTITVTVAGDDTTGDTDIDDVVPPQFTVTAIDPDSPITCSPLSGNVVDCTLPEGTAAGSYDVDVTVDVSEELSGQECTTYVNEVRIIGPDVVGELIPDLDIPEYVATANDGVIIECGEVGGSGILRVLKVLDINGNGIVDLPGEGEIAWDINIEGVDTTAPFEESVNIGEVISIEEALQQGYTVVGVRVDGGPLQPGVFDLDLLIENELTIVRFYNQPVGPIVVHKDTIARHNGGAPVDRPNDDDGWIITVSSEDCDVFEQKQTDANGNAVFEDLPECDDYVVSENPVNASSPGYTPQGATSVSNVTPGGATIVFTNAILTFDPVCTNISQCGPVTLVNPTPTNTPVVPPTETPVPPTTTPEEDIEGERTPGPGDLATPIAPDTGSGAGGAMPIGMNVLLVVAGLVVLGSGLAIATAARRRG